MPEKLVHIYGKPKEYIYEEYIAPKHKKNIKIIKPDKPIFTKLLSQEDIYELDEERIIPAWTADKISRNFMTIDEWVITREYKNTHIPTNLLEEDVFLVGKENPDWYIIIEQAVIWGIVIFSVLFAFLVTYPLCELLGYK